MQDEGTGMDVGWLDPYLTVRPGKEKVIDPNVQKLMDMGFEEAQCVQALIDAKGDENVAIEALLS